MIDIYSGGIYLSDVSIKYKVRKSKLMGKKKLLEIYKDSNYVSSIYLDKYRLKHSDIVVGNKTYKVVLKDE